MYLELESKQDTPLFIEERIPTRSENLIIGYEQGILKQAGRVDLSQDSTRSEPNTKLKRSNLGLDHEGGIDLTSDNLNLQTNNSGEWINFRMDPAMLKQLHNASGFVPVIIQIQPLGSLSEFLGLD